MILRKFKGLLDFDQSFVDGECRAAVLSSDGRYRYRLIREWDSSPEKAKAVYVGLNPSTADGKDDDATIRRLRNFSKEFGCGRFEIVNLFAFRATDPRQLALPDDPEGPNNALMCRDALVTADLMVCCWGSNSILKAYPDVPRRMFNLINCLAYSGGCRTRPMAFGRNKDGQPKHPLYLPKSAGLESYTYVD